MTGPFPRQRFLRGNFAPLRVECDAPDLIVEGEIPATLNGTLLRNGPNPMFPPRDRYHMFSGDGMVHAFRIENGRVAYRNRWVRTAKLEAEIAAGEALFGTFANPATSDPAVRGRPYNVANTNVIVHAGRVLALEEYSPPFELERDTLASIGPWDFGGGLQGPMTAHPRTDPETGELHFFAYGIDGPGSAAMGYYVADADGRIDHSVRFDAPYAAMVHDFAITESHVIFPVFPLTISPGRAASGGALLAWDPDLPTRIGVMPRRGGADDLVWYEGEPCCVFHPMNAHETADAFVLDVLKYDAAPGFPHADGTPPDPADAEARLERWRLPRAGGTSTYATERLDDLASEYPRVDERRTGRPYRFGYMASTPSERGRAAVFDEIVRYDFDAGRKATYALPQGDFTSEPVFVPRDAAAPEGVGWLLAVVYRGQERRSDLIVLDAEDVAHGPVATAQLETRVPFGFHGNWVPPA